MAEYVLLTSQMFGIKAVRKWLFPVATLIFSLPAHGQFERQGPCLTIPEGIARGSVGTVATVPSGQMPSMAALLRSTDVIVTGTIGEAHSYLSDDQCNVYTDYPIVDAVVLFYHYKPDITSPAKAGLQGLTVTQLGGTLTVNGTKFTHKEPALPPLQPGSKALLLLQRSGDKYFITGKFFGAFSVTDGKLISLMTREDFAPEYRNMRLEDALDSMVKLLRDDKQ